MFLDIDIPGFTWGYLYYTNVELVHKSHIPGEIILPPPEVLSPKVASTFIVYVFVSPVNSFCKIISSEDVVVFQSFKQTDIIDVDPVVGLNHISLVPVTFLSFKTIQLYLYQ